VGTHHFTCNSFHEIDFGHPFDNHMKDQDHHISHIRYVRSSRVKQVSHK
jgi:hypothetical protein